MSKEEILKIQTCVLKVNIHCDGCKQKVKKILQKIEGVFTIKIDAEQGKVTVSGNVHPAVLIKKLTKSGKHAELWGAQKASSNNNQNQLANQLKNMQIDNGKGGNKKGQKGNNDHQLPKSGQPNQLQQNPHLQQQLKQLLQLQQMNGLQDLKLPNMPNLKMPNQQDWSDDGFDDFDDEDDDFDDYDEVDDEMDAPHHHHPLNKMKAPVMVNAPQGLNNMMMNGMLPQATNAQNGAPNAGGNGKKAGGGGASGNGAVPVQLNTGGKKGGGNTNNGGNQNQGGKNGGGKPQESKNGNGGGGGGNNNKSGHNGNGGGGGNNINVNGAKKGNNANAGGGAAKDGFHMGGPYGNLGQMGNVPAVQGLPAAAMGGGGGYFHGAGPDLMPGNPLHAHAQQQQYMAAAMMNQQRAMGNERFQAMTYARPPPAVNYMPQYPYPYGPYPYPQPHGSDPCSSFFSDENASSCSVM